MQKLGKTPSLRRLPVYLHILKELAAEGQGSVSTSILGERTGHDPIVVRKDLALTGIVGTPRIGYPTTELIDAIVSTLHWDHLHDAVLVGAGRLGATLLGYDGFMDHGLRLLAAFDSDPSKSGRTMHGKPVYPDHMLEDFIINQGVQIGVLTVPPEAAIEAAQRMVAAGIRAIWNFTPVALSFGPGVIVQREDFMGGLAVLLAQLANDSATADIG